MNGNREVGDVTLVTGGSRGIGAAIARVVGRTGGVVVAARSEAGCQAVAEEIRAGGGRAWALLMDVGDAAAISAGVARARELVAGAGPIARLVNNAGVAESAPLLAREGTNEALYAKHMDVNFHGPRRLCEELLPGMLELGRGAIVNVASSAGLRGYAYVSSYCASKFALVGYTLAAAEELAKSGVTVNAVCPHYVDSPMLTASVEKVMQKTGKERAEVEDFFRRQNPGGRLVREEEVAMAVEQALAERESGLVYELDGSGELRVRRPNRVSGGR